jgi:hypothetical protein
MGKHLQVALDRLAEYAVGHPNHDTVDIVKAARVELAATGDALVKAECALADIAEGEHSLGSVEALDWAERRSTQALAIIRPVMRDYGIRTSG